jgi:hypothetical protein
MQSATKFYSRSHDAVIRVYDEAGNVIETHKHAFMLMINRALPKKSDQLPLLLSDGE